MKTLLRIVLVLLVLVVLGVIGAFTYVDTIAKRAVETGATSALGVDTTVKKINVGIFKGELTLGGLDVANPKGFDTPHFLALGDGDVAVSLATLRNDTIELPRLNLSGIDVHLQRTAAGSNYQVILDHLKGKESGGGGKDTKEPSTKYVIHEVLIKNVVVHVDLLGLQKADVKVPEIKLQNVGSGGGMQMSELTGTLVKAVLTAAIENSNGLIPQELLNDLAGQLASLKSLESLGVENLRGKVQDLTKDLPTSLPANLDKPLKDLGNLVPGGKTDR